MTSRSRVSYSQIGGPRGVVPRNAHARNAYDAMSDPLAWRLPLSFTNMGGPPQITACSTQSGAPHRKGCLGCVEHQALAAHSSVRLAERALRTSHPRS